MLLRILENTVFKRVPKQSAELSDDQKQPIAAGQTFVVASQLREGNHIKVALKETSFKGFNTWYVFSGHVELKNNDGSLVLPPELKLNVPFYPQTDNYRDPHRTCNSSSCAMAAKFLGAAISGDDDYVERVFRIGDTTDHGVQTEVLATLGIKSEWRTDLDFSDLDRELLKGRPIVIGILHRGPLHAPIGGGHIIVCVGRTETGYICHDPYGCVLDGYSSDVDNGRFVEYSRDVLYHRWLLATPRNGWGRVFLP